MTPETVFLRNQIPVQGGDGYKREFEVEACRIVERLGCVWFKYDGKEYYVPLTNIDGIVCK